MSETQNSNVLEEGQDVSETNEDENPVGDDVEEELENTAAGVTDRADDGATREVKLDGNLLSKWSKVFSACWKQQWDELEQFLLDEDISKDDKKKILNFKNIGFRRVVIGNGAPLSIIKALIDVFGADMVIPTISGRDGCSWLHESLKHKGTPLEVIQFYVDIGGKELLLMQSKNHFGRTALHIAVGIHGRQDIIEHFLRVGGLELLDITDKGGFQVIDYCGKAEKEVIMNCLRSMEMNPSVRTHLERFESSTITPKEIENWICKGQLEHLRDYLSNDKISKREKINCLKYKESSRGRNLLHLCCFHCYPVDITRLILDLMDGDYPFYLDDHGNTCLHLACSKQTDVDTKRRYEVVQFLIDHIGSCLLHQVNNGGETVLFTLITYNSKENIDLDLIKMMINIGGKDLLLVQDSMQCSALHHISMGLLAGKEPEKEIFVYLVSKGGSKLRELTDDTGKKAEDYWTDDLKEYIQLSTSELPSLSDDIQCPICFEAMTDVLLITRCFHRFCRKCITESYLLNGHNCPICRMDFSFEDLRHDPLLTRLVEVATREKDAKDLLQEEVQPLRKKLKMDSEPKQS